MPKAEDLCKVAPAYLGTPYSKMDCQAFVERCLKDIGISRNLAGSNAWYRQMTWTGTPAECIASFGKIPKGAFLFILKQDGKEPAKYKPDGIGNASHIGIYTGMSGAEMCKLSGVQDAVKYNYGDGAINSSSTHKCVCTSRFAGKAISGGWNRIGLWDALTYDFGLPIDQQPADKLPTLQRGDKGSYVTLAQTKLINAGYSCGPDGADGDFGKNTEKAVIAFQKDWNLEPDGIIGQRTWAQLNSTPGRKLFTVTIPNLTQEQAKELTDKYSGASIVAES